MTCVTWQIKFNPFTLACIFHSTRAGDVSGVVSFKNLTLRCGAFCNFRSERLSNAPLCPVRGGGGGVRGFTLTGALLCSKIRGTQRFRSLEMHSKRSYKIGICSVIRARGAWGFSKLQRFHCYFPEKFRWNWTFYESENFSNSSRALHHFSIISLNTKISGFLFATKPITLGVKCENFRASEIRI